MYEITLPRFSDDHDESSIVIWFKQEGDEVTEGEVLAEVQTEKTVSEIETDKGGVLEKIYVKRGEAANVGDVLCTVNTESEADATKAKDTPKTSEEDTSKNNDAKQSFVRVAPRLRKLAKDLGVDLTAITGSGRDGKIVEEDIRKQAEGVDPDENTGQPLTGVRKTIAERMKGSLHNSAQLTETAYANVTNLSELRAKHETKLSWNTWISYAVIKALRNHLYMNGTYENDLLKQSEEVHLGTATDTEDGLLVPVVENADDKSMGELENAIANNSELAHSRKLSQAQMKGSTFTISNLGAYGVHFFTPIINPPEIAILGLGKIENHLFKQDGEIKEGKRLPLSLTIDHQIVDGGPAATFLKTLIDMLENPDKL